MVSRYPSEPLLLEYVKALENKGNWARGDQILAILSALGIEPVIQECHWPRIRNIIVDLSTNLDVKRILFSAHYDVVKGSPGANDNASGVAVLLGLCHELGRLATPVKIVFFDREEAWFRTPVIRLGLLGSLYYICRSNVKSIVAVYNLEFCGLGDFLGIWSIAGKQTDLPALQQIKIAALGLGLPFKSAHIPWPLLTSDHLPFRLKGISNSITLSLLPKDNIEALENLLSSLSLRKLLIGQRPVLPKPLHLIHSSDDTSFHVNEKSLKLMLVLLLELIRSYEIRGSVSPADNRRKVLEELRPDGISHW